MRDVVLIPAYEPDDVLITLSERLKNDGFDVLVVDDGSGEDYSKIFDRVKDLATVISHDKNCGKGAALKTGLKYIRDNFVDFENVITCDADGQHCAEDVARVRDCLHKGQRFVLTVRQAKHKVPLRSKVGNNLSRFVYALLTNRYLSDNQSGLRGFNKCHIDWLVEVEKDNYDYEMNVLYYAAKKNIYIATLPIEALYINNNSSSHFSPILDTVRIYKSLFALAMGSFISLFTAEVLAFVVSFTLGYKDLHFTLPGIGAISCLVCILLNRFVFFKHTPCFDYWKILIYTIISYFIYTLFCALWMYASLGTMPLWLSFNITYLTCLPLRYYMHKFIFIASKTKEE